MYFVNTENKARVAQVNTESKASMHLVNTEIRRVCIK